MGAEHLKKYQFKKGNTMGFKPGNPGGWKIRNGRLFGKRYGRKGGKARWASMTQDEKDMFEAKKAYSRQQNKRIRTQVLGKMSLKPAKNLSAQEIEEIDEFFGDII